MQRIGASLRVEFAGANPAPVAAAAGAVHVVAAVSLVRDDSALWALFAVLPYGRRCGLLNSGVIAHPIRARLAGMGVAMRETVPGASF